MSKSTPLSELNSDMNNSTQPLVHDILKEIQQESVTSNVEMQQLPPLQETNSYPPVELQGGQMVEPNQELVYSQQQEEAIQYQMDPNLQLTDQQTVPTQVMDAPMVIPSTEVQYQTSPPLGQRIFEEVKEPLLVAVLTILVSVPVISEFLGRNLAKLPGGSNTVTPILIKALLVASLFYVARKLI